MEYKLKLSEKATMIINIGGPELYRGQKAENLASLENISQLIKEVLKSRHNDITIVENAERPSPELLAVIKERGECGKGRYENPEIGLDIEWDYQVFKGSIGKYSYNDPFLKEGELTEYFALGKYAAVFTDYEDTMEYSGMEEDGIITKFFNGGHSVTYLARDFRITAVERELETVALRVPKIWTDFKAYDIQGLSGMRAGRKTRLILPDESEIVITGGKTSYVDGKDVIIPESLEDEREDRITEKYPCKDWKDMKNRLEDAFESFEKLNVPSLDAVREDLFEKIERFRELAERYSIHGISDSFDASVRNFEETIKKIYEPEILSPLTQMLETDK